MWRRNVPCPRILDNVNHVNYPRPQVTSPQRRFSSLLPPGGVPFPFLEVMSLGASGAGEIDVDVIPRAATDMIINSSHLSAIASMTLINIATIIIISLSSASFAGGLRVVIVASLPAASVSRRSVVRVSVTVSTVTVTSTATNTAPIILRAISIDIPTSTVLVTAPVFLVPASASASTVSAAVIVTAFNNIGITPTHITTAAHH